MEWKEVRLGDICEIKNGFAFKSKDFIDHGVPVIKIKNVKPNQILLDDISYVSEEVASNYRCLWIMPKDIVITMTGNRIDGSPDSWVGKVSLFRNNGRYLLNQRLSIIRPTKDVDSVFLSYLLSSWDAQLYFARNANSSGGQANISPQIVKDYELFMPQEIEDQRRIAAILSSLDRKIELNNQINKTLEEMAQAIFKNWFVDFGPFQDGEFVESELGLIPKDLKMTTVAELEHSLETGRRPKGGVGELKTGVPSIGAEHVKGMGNYDYSKTKYVPEEYAKTLKTGRIKGYELLIYKDGGKPGYFIPNYSIFGEGYPFEVCYLNEHVFKLDFNGNRGFNAFCYFYFQTNPVMTYLNAQGGKAAIPGINRGDIEAIVIPSPDNDMVKKFGTFVLPIIKTMLKNMKQNRALAELRDTLLPKLISGEIEL